MLDNQDKQIITDEILRENKKSRWGRRFSAPVQIGFGAHPASYTMNNGSLSRG
jgi:hypothetical protein